MQGMHRIMVVTMKDLYSVVNNKRVLSKALGISRITLDNYLKDGNNVFIAKIKMASGEEQYTLFTPKKEINVTSLLEMLNRPTLDLDQLKTA